MTDESRLNNIERKIDTLITAISEIAVLTVHIEQTKKDIDRAYDMLRAHEKLHQLLAQHNVQMQEVVSDMPRIERLLTDSDNGIIVRLTKIEGRVATNWRLTSYMAGLWTTVVVASLGYAVTFILERISTISGAPP